MTSTLKQNKSKIIVLFISTLLTTNALISMQEHTPARKVVIINNLLTPIAVTLYYHNLEKDTTKEKKFSLNPRNVSKDILLPSNKTVHYKIETEYGTDDQCYPTCKSIHIFAFGENRINIEKLIAPSIVSSTQDYIAFSREYKGGRKTTLLLYNKKQDATSDNPDNQITATTKTDK